MDKKLDEILSPQIMNNDTCPECYVNFTEAKQAIEAYIAERESIAYDKGLKDGDAETQVTRERLAERETQARIDELEYIAPDMRYHSEYKGYVETSISGKWQPLSKRLDQLKSNERVTDE